MEKVYGSPKRQDGLYKVGRNKWELIYGFGKDSEDAPTGWNWRERFTHRPSLDEIKAAIIDAIKAESACQLRYGMKWNGLTVEYTEERKSDLTGIIVGLQGGFMQLPIELNLGSSADGTPSVFTFTTPEQIGEVAAGIAAHKTAVSKAEWEAINALDDMAAYQTVQ
ncbi:hypothetical protein [Muribaculum intestinale]|uniref:hypothetical protein n=1 Tax=Muribaculum intestinale TaxID=1796646 RepID=UPI0025B79235|nr:hypothetical protein [Muribaculum intestinale]